MKTGLTVIGAVLVFAVLILHLKYAPDVEPLAGTSSFETVSTTARAQELQATPTPGAESTRLSPEEVLADTTPSPPLSSEDLQLALTLERNGDQDVAARLLGYRSALEEADLKASAGKLALLENAGNARISGLRQMVKAEVSAAKQRVNTARIALQEALHERRQGKPEKSPALVADGSQP